jgi:hypothetical protein
LRVRAAGGRCDATSTLEEHETAERAGPRAPAPPAIAFEKVQQEDEEMTTKRERPPTKPSEEATNRQLDLAGRQGEAIGAAVREMTEHEAQRLEIQAGEFLVGCAVEHAEGLYYLRN